MKHYNNSGQQLAHAMLHIIYKLLSWPLLTVWIWLCKPVKHTQHEKDGWCTSEHGIYEAPYYEDD